MKKRNGTRQLMVCAVFIVCFAMLAADIGAVKKEIIPLTGSSPGSHATEQTPSENWNALRDLIRSPQSSGGQTAVLEETPVPLALPDEAGNTPEDSTADGAAQAEDTPAAPEAETDAEAPDSETPAEAEDAAASAGEQTEDQDQPPQAAEEQAAEEASPGQEGQSEQESQPEETEPPQEEQPAFAESMSFEGDGFVISAEAGEAAQLPAETELTAEEIVPEDKNYDAWYDEALKALQETPGGEGIEELKSARFYDISLLADGRSIEPEDTVSITISYDKAFRAENKDDIRIIHFGVDENGDLQPEILEEQAVDVSAKENRKKGTVSVSDVSFEANSFSIYAVVEAPEPVSGVDHAQSISELDGYGFMLSVTKENSQNTFYMTDTIVSANGLKLIGKTAANVEDDATIWYFEKAEGTDNIFHLFCRTLAGKKQYMVMDGSGRMSLSETDPTPFSIELTGDQSGKFFISRQSGTKKYYLNMKNGEVGKGFAGSTYDDDGSMIALTKKAKMQDDPYGLDGRSYGLVNYTTGTVGVAMMAEPMSGGQRLIAKEVVLRNSPLNQRSKLYVAKNSDITLWTFHKKEEDTYYVTVGTAGNEKYLRITDKALSLAASPDDDCVLKVTPGSGRYAGKIRLSNKKNYAPNLSRGTASNGFGSLNDSGDHEWFELAQLSQMTADDFMVYTADKISVSDAGNMANGRQVIIYTRIWNGTTKEYEYYAIDHNGDLVRAYESGNTVQWVGLKVNTMLWDFTEYYYEGTKEPNYYYELQNTYSGKYIAPQIRDGQVLSGQKIGINLNGRRYGDYFSTILAWDDPHYDYAGLRIDGGRLVSCPMAEAEDFYFAAMEPVTDELTKVPTVDQSALGITMKMQNYNGKKTNNGGRDRTQTSVLGSDTFIAKQATAGLLSTDLKDNGFPVAEATGKSLSELYSDSQNVDHLFLKNTYDESGYFEFDSTKNFAHLGKNGNFTVYNQLGTVETVSPSLEHGQFMPYNTISPGGFSVQHPVNMTGRTNQELPDEDPRKGEPLYGIPYDPAKPAGEDNNADYHFGMDLSADFMQSPGGVDNWGHDIIFSFSGDDDMWLYIDGELVLDLGGVHSALTGTINFRTGEVVSNGTATTLRAIFESNCKARGMSQAQIEQRMTDIFGTDQKSTVFADYSAHTMRMFYMERGAGSSNLHVRFNMATTKKGNVQFGKTVSGTDKQDYSSVKFPYQIWYRNDGKWQTMKQEEHDGSYNVTLKGSREQVDFDSSWNGYEDVFYLKPGQQADIHFPDDDTEYYIAECGVNTRIYDQVKINGETAEPKAGKGGRADFLTSHASVGMRKQVSFDNHVDPDALRSLTITKKLFDENGSPLTAEQDPTTFRIRIRLGDDLSFYRQDTYYVKDPEGNYCIYEKGEGESAGKFVSTGKKNYADLSDKQKAKAVNTTSPSGAADKIPAGYSVEIRNLLVDTKFRVSEEAGDVPAGYRLDKYHRVDGSYITDPGDDTVNAGSIRDNSDPQIEVHNRRGWGLTAHKVWTDADFMESHDPIYTAVFIMKDKAGGGKDLQLVEGTVRQMTGKQTSLNYFFDALQKGAAFSDYTVREVEVTDPRTDENGHVTGYSGIRPIDPGAVITGGGTSDTGAHEEGLTYTVTYAAGKTGGVNQNVRTDTITNTRPGLKMVKTDWHGKALAGAGFTLKNADDSSVGAGEFMSGSDGLITYAYLKPGKYILTEKSAPQGYSAMKDALTISVSDHNEISVSGGEEDSYEFDQSGSVLVIKNRSMSFAVRKVDAQDMKTPLENVHFAIYRQVKDSEGKEIRDYQPLEGAEDLVTDAQGMLPEEELQKLTGGTYYLVETQTIQNYRKNAEDICFTVSGTGQISLKSGGGAQITESQTKDGSLKYLLIVPNSRGEQKVSFRKVDSASPDEGLAGAEFALYQVRGDEKAEPELLYKALISDQEGMLTVGRGQTQFKLQAGTYQLIETKAPAGYEKLSRPVIVRVSASGVSYDDGFSLSTSGQGVSGDVKAGFELKLSNTSGVIIPSTGGRGVTGFYIFGCLLLVVCGSILAIRRRITFRA